MTVTSQSSRERNRKCGSSQRSLTWLKCWNDFRGLRHDSGRSLQRATQSSSSDFHQKCGSLLRLHQFASMLRNWLFYDAQNVCYHMSRVCNHGTDQSDRWMDVARICDLKCTLELWTGTCFASTESADSSHVRLQISALGRIFAISHG